MHQQHDIQNHAAIRRAALAQGKSVLAQLDNIGNIRFNVMPIVFDSIAELRAYRDANRGFLYSVYQGTR